MLEILYKYKYVIVLVIVLLVGVLLPVSSGKSEEICKEMRGEVDNLTYMVDLVNYDNAQIKRKVDTSLEYSANISSKISSDFYVKLNSFYVKLNSYDSKIKSVQDTIDYTLNRLVSIDELLADIDGAESFNRLVANINSLTREIILLKIEINDIKASISALDTRLKKLE